MAFLATSQAPHPSTGDQILIRSNAPLGNLTAAVKGTIEAVNPNILISFHVFETEIRNSLLRERLMATLSGFFGGLALLLACIGLYGIMSYGVAGRTGEIGIRMALGAQGRNVLWLIMRETLLLVVIGIAVGLPAVLAGTWWISSLLYGLAPGDPVSIGIASLLMMGVAAAAGYIPARRAARVDPIEALRQE